MPVKHHCLLFVYHQHQEIRCPMHIICARINCIKIFLLIVRQFTTDELNVATSSYNTLIGKGGFGSVYLGIFHGLEVAVKVLDVSVVQYVINFDKLSTSFLIIIAKSEDRNVWSFFLGG